MSKQTLALAYTRPSDTLDEAEYHALVEALSESARGRSFLAEHARRTRTTETKILLNAIERIEAQIQPRPPDPVYDDLRRVLDDLHTARARIEAGGKVPQAEQLATLLDLLLRRISKLVPPAPVAAQPAIAAPQVVAAPAPPRPAAIRWLEDPLEPPPAVNDASPPPRPAAKVVEKIVEKTAGQASAKPAVKTAEKVSARTVDARATKVGTTNARVIDQIAAETLRTSARRTPPATERRPRAAPTLEIEAEIKALVDAEVDGRTKKPPTAAATPAPTANAVTDALAAIMALSEEERIALFT